MLFCSFERVTIPDLSNTKKVEIDYYINGTNKTPVIITDTNEFDMIKFRQLSKSVPGYRPNRICNGKIKYFNSLNDIVLEGEFSIDTNDDLQPFKISKQNQKNAFYFAIPEDIIFLLEVMNPKFNKNEQNSKYHQRHGHGRIGSIVNPFKRKVLPKFSKFQIIFISRFAPYRIQVIKWASPKDKLNKNSIIAIKYVAIDTSQARHWYSSIDSIVSEHRMLSSDTGSAQIYFQMSTVGASNITYKDTSMYWNADNIISISFYNGDFITGYWDYEKVYFNSTFAAMIKAKAAETGLLED
jgi:hypothetical protein